MLLQQFGGGISHAREYSAPAHPTPCEIFAGAYARALERWVHVQVCFALLLLPPSALPRDCAVVLGYSREDLAPCILSQSIQSRVPLLESQSLSLLMIGLCFICYSLTSSLRPGIQQNHGPRCALRRYTHSLYLSFFYLLIHGIREWSCNLSASP